MILLWCALLIVTTVTCQEDKPDITLLSIVNNTSIDHTCVAGSNVDGSAITFITPIGDSYKDITSESKYMFQGTEYSKDEYSCDFETGNDCMSKWTGTVATVEQTNNTNNIHKVVLDERWEKFTTYSYEHKTQPHTINSENINIGISVRTGGIASLVLCDTNTPMKCLWISLNDNKKLTVRNCSTVHINRFDVENSKCTNNILGKEMDFTLSEKNWNHFILSNGRDNNMDSLQIYRRNECIKIPYSDINNLQNMYLHLEKKGFWKIHNYAYLSLHQSKANNEWYDLGPELKPENGALCVALYVAMCETCKLSFRFNGKYLEEKKKSKKQWDYIKLIIPNAEETTYKLQVKAMSSDSTSSTGFWFIDDVRRCHINETRVIKTSAPMSDKDTVSCVVLKKPKWMSSNIAGKVGTTVNRLCNNNSEYIGNNCNISCSSVLGNEQKNCNKYIICKPTNNSKDPQCSCSAGYYGDQCNEPCPLGFYGYNCFNICEPCAGFCLRTSGICPPSSACTGVNKANAGCNTAELLYMLAPPRFINSTLTTITVLPEVRKTNSNIIYSYQMEYKVWNTANWMPYGEDRQTSEELQEITIRGLTPMTDYKIRMVLYAEDETYNTSQTYHISTSATTTCKNITSGIYYENLKFEKQSTHVSISWVPICNGILILSISYKKEKSLSCVIPSAGSESINIAAGKHIIQNLIPDTEYDLEVQVIDDDASNNSATSDKMSFSTAESELPVLNAPPNIVSTTLTTITLKFHEKDITKGKLANTFLVQYKYNQTGDVWNNATSNINGIKTTNEVTLPSLQMKTTYHIRVVIYTSKGYCYDACLPIATATTTCADSSEHELITELKVKPDKNKAMVTWTPVCENKFKIKIKCGEDTWCTSPSDIPAFDNNSGSYTIMGLIPFTKYTMEFIVNNKQYKGKKKIVTETFKTKPDAPPPVTELQVYSFDSDTISVRFKKPDPPHGELLNYEQRTIKCSSNFYENWLPNLAKDCDIWNGFQCLETTGEFEELCYKIAIRANNKNVKDKAKYEYINITMKNTEAPRNLKETDFQICWDHPEFTKGPLQDFQFTINQIESNLFMNAEFVKTINYCNISTPQKNYCYKIPSNLPPSRKYNIMVQGRNKKEQLGESANVTIFSSPIQSKLVRNITANERTNTTQTITIPEFDTNTLTTSSSVYVVVCDPTSTYKQPKNEIVTNIRTNLFSKSMCEGTFWVAAKLNATKEEIVFTVGEGEENEPLRPDVNYTISVFLVNEYNNKFSFERYSIITSAPVPPSSINPWIYSLLLLLLIIPIVGFYLYRKYRKPEFHPQPSISFQEVPIRNNNIPIRTFLNNISRNLPNRKNENLQNDHELPLIPNRSDEPFYTELVKIGNLSQYVKDSLENGELERQHALFPKGGIKPWDYGMAKENKFKNRYNNLSAYDHSRVVLNKLPNDPFSDFINANYIDGYNKPRAYIATQGPKPSTLNDFWRMIWQENVKYIVMLANLVEGNKPKCEQYWPELGSTQEYYNVTVTFLQTNIFADFEYRYFEATCDGQTRKIQHLHFTSWPDHGVPQYPQSLVPFLRRILTIPTTAPIVVHCSAGVGRTGTIILADICLRMAAVEGQVDVLKYMHSIREQRAKLVDNFDQYKLVHMILLECLLAPETSLPCEHLAKTVSELIQHGGLQKQISYLRDTAWHSQVMKNPIRIEPENVSKNRFPDIIPNIRRIYISRYPYEDEYSDYINAVPVDGFRNKEQFIVTQTPLPHTVKDFWRMIFENNVKVIVSLNEIIINDKNCCLFWPVENGQYTPVPYLTLNYLSIKEGANYDTYNIQLVNTKTTENSVSTISIIQYKNWKREQLIPDNMDVFIRVIEEAQNLSRRGDPSVVACYDGSSASGLFVALSFLIEKMKLEQICDVCQAVRSIRINRSQFISHRKQFEFLYQAAVHYVASFDDYSNFEGPRKS